jgi:putative transposase
LAIDKACHLARLSRSCWYKPRKNEQQEGLRMRIQEIANDRPRFGCERIHVMLKREGWQINLKRVHRLYCLEGLQVRMRRRRKKHMSLHRGIPPPASGPNERWSMDFVHDQLSNGLAFRVLTVVDNWSRESVLPETGFRLTSQDVILALDRAAQSRKLPTSITVDHGTEFTSLVMDDWAHVNRVSLAFTRPGKPTDNGLCVIPPYK